MECSGKDSVLVLHFVLPSEHGAFALALLLHGFLRDAALLNVSEALGVLLGGFAPFLLFRLVVFFNQLFFFRLRRFGASAASGSSVELFAAPPFR